jgi:UDP-N-acetylglucosamine diphosphorylase/glucosamine-1-phosphate N-acetyltransferase
MHLCLFEDQAVRNLHPLTYFRPGCDLRSGILTLREKALVHLSPKRVTLHTRQYLAQLTRELNPGLATTLATSDEVLFLNGRCIVDKRLARILSKAGSGVAFKSGDTVVAAKLKGTALGEAQALRDTDFFDLGAVDNLRVEEIEAAVVNYPWHLVYANASGIAEDFLQVTRKGKNIQRKGSLHRTTVLLGKSNIAIGRKTEVGPGVVLDARTGPIYIGANVTIHPGAVIEGPCYIGPGSSIKIGARIYGNTSIGPMCKVGGEVVHSTLHGYCNKQHDGFLGHSYLGEWVNLGAGTNTSNLKNTYGNIRVFINGSPVDSGKMFVGLTAGDHVKTGINATLDTGTVIGPSSNVYGTALPPKYVPPFSFGEAGSLQTYGAEKALEVARIVMRRRNIEPTSVYEQVFRHVYVMTEDERTRNRHA